MLSNITPELLTGRKVIQDSLKSIISSFDDELLQSCYSALAFDQERTLILTNVQVFLSLDELNPTKRSILRLLFNHAIDSERMAPEGFITCIRFVRDELRFEIYGEQHLSLKVLSDTVSSSRANIPTLEDFEWLVDRNVRDLTIRSMLKEAMQLSGFRGSINVQKTHLKPSIELVEGYKFDIPAVLGTRGSVENCKTVIIDGFVETVSEVHHLFTYANESGENVLLVTKGLSDDVVSTIKANLEKNRFNLYPYVVTIDIDSVNILNDLAAVTGSEVVSSVKGQLISSIDLSSLNSVKRIDLEPHGFTIVDHSRKSAVDSHRAMLLNMKGDEHSRELRALRAMKLHARKAIVRLDDDVRVNATMIELDRILRGYVSLLDHGTLNVHGQKWLTSTVVAGTLFAKRFLDTIGSLGAIVSV